MGQDHPPVVSRSIPQVALLNPDQPLQLWCRTKHFESVLFDSFFKLCSDSCLIHVEHNEERHFGRMLEIIGGTFVEAICEVIVRNRCVETVCENMLKECSTSCLTSFWNMLEIVFKLVLEAIVEIIVGTIVEVWVHSWNHCSYHVFEKTFRNTCWIHFREYILKDFRTHVWNHVWQHVKSCFEIVFKSCPTCLRNSHCMILGNCLSARDCKKFRMSVDIRFENCVWMHVRNNSWCHCSNSLLISIMQHFLNRCLKSFLW